MLDFLSLADFLFCDSGFLSGWFRYFFGNLPNRTPTHPRPIPNKSITGRGLSCVETQIFLQVTRRATKIPPGKHAYLFLQPKFSDLNRPALAIEWSMAGLS